jgi:hypothetical protein
MEKSDINLIKSRSFLGAPILIYAKNENTTGGN